MESCFLLLSLASTAVEFGCGILEIEESGSLALEIERDKRQRNEEKGIRETFFFRNRVWVREIFGGKEKINRRQFYY